MGGAKYWSYQISVVKIFPNDNELIKIAQEKGGAYYSFETGKHEDLEVGAHVIVYWNGQQLDSNPPQRGLE